MNMYINQKYTCQNVKKKKPFHFFFPKRQILLHKRSTMSQHANTAKPTNKRVLPDDYCNADIVNGSVLPKKVRSRPPTKPSLNVIEERFSSTGASFQVRLSSTYSTYAQFEAATIGYEYRL